ncbi:hypothetical protein PGTUg99_012563 [Puccinia graminis f. sp. tritici]|uniref:Uncharacterized protein n=1 Tax=Puccinia graminis f. sp. tritici TaxID=56615 RepID=A0A5B0NIB0_PUCGR|nr:hypothetical protein PGTUg99_012563 [Puccinia graminis f. sp. tritici]
MCDLLVGNKGYQLGSWDPTSMHIRCFCHKLALIVNAGLQALSLKILPPKKEKASVLGFFPVLGRMVEEDEQDLGVQDLLVDVKGAKKTSPPINLAIDSDSDYGNADDETSDKGPEESDEIDSDHETPVSLQFFHSKWRKKRSHPPFGMEKWVELDVPSSTQLSQLLFPAQGVGLQGMTSRSPAIIVCWHKCTPRTSHS